MVKFAQIWWVLVDVLNHLQSFFSHSPFFWTRLLEVVVPLLNQNVLAERVADAFKANQRCNKREVSNRDMIGDYELFADTAQIFFEDSQSTFNTLSAIFVSWILKFVCH